jgi:hypothetical protein
MKNNCLIVVLCFFVAPIFGQNNRYQNDISAVYDTLAAATKRSDFNKILDYTYPKIFDLVPREKMLSVMSNALSDTSIMKFTIIKSKIDSFSNDTLVVGNELFTFFYRSNEMQFVFTRDTSESEEDQKQFLDLMETSYKEQFGEENVSVNREKRAFTVIGKEGLNLCANSSPTRDKNGWTIMEIKLEKLPLLKKILPAKVVDWVKKH